MCNPIAMMGMSLMQQSQKAESLALARKQDMTQYQMAAQAEKTRRSNEELAIRMEADKISRDVKRASSTTTTTMAAAGLDLPVLVDQWAQVESERQGSLAAKDRLMAEAGSMRMAELVERRNQRLAAHAAPSSMDWAMAAVTGYMQGKLIQNQLSPNTDKTGTLTELPEDATLGQSFEYHMDKFLEMGWLNPSTWGNN